MKTGIHETRWNGDEVFIPGPNNLVIDNGGGAGGAVDTTARTQASAARVKASEIAPDAGATVDAGNTVFLIGVLWMNDTAGAITIPATIDAASLAGAGFTERVDTAMQISRLNPLI